MQGSLAWIHWHGGLDTDRLFVLILEAIRVSYRRINASSASILQRSQAACMLVADYVRGVWRPAVRTQHALG